MQPPSDPRLTHSRAAAASQAWAPAGMVTGLEPPVTLRAGFEGTPSVTESAGKDPARCGPGPLHALLAVATAGGTRCSLVQATHGTKQISSRHDGGSNNKRKQIPGAEGEETRKAGAHDPRPKRAPISAIIGGGRNTLGAGSSGHQDLRATTAGSRPEPVKNQTHSTNCTNHLSLNRGDDVQRRNARTCSQPTSEIVINTVLVHGLVRQGFSAQELAEVIVERLKSSGTCREYRILALRPTQQRVMGLMLGLRFSSTTEACMVSSLGQFEIPAAYRYQKERLHVMLMSELEMVKKVSEVNKRAAELDKGARESNQSQSQSTPTQTASSTPSSSRLACRTQLSSDQPEFMNPFNRPVRLGPINPSRNAQQSKITIQSTAVTRDKTTSTLGQQSSSESNIITKRLDKRWSKLSEKAQVILREYRAAYRGWEWSQEQEMKDLSQTFLLNAIGFLDLFLTTKEGSLEEMIEYNDGWYPKEREKKHIYTNISDKNK